MDGSQVVEQRRVRDSAMARVEWKVEGNAAVAGQEVFQRGRRRF